MDEKHKESGVHSGNNYTTVETKRAAGNQESQNMEHKPQIHAVLNPVQNKRENGNHSESNVKRNDF